MPSFPSASLNSHLHKEAPASQWQHSIWLGESRERTHNAGESSPGGTQQDGHAGSADITLCSSFFFLPFLHYIAHTLPNYLCMYPKYMHYLAPPTICLIALPGNLKSRGCIRKSSWPCKANVLLTSSGRCLVRAQSAPSPVVPCLYWC